MLGCLVDIIEIRIIVRLIVVIVGIERDGVSIFGIVRMFFLMVIFVAYLL